MIEVIVSDTGIGIREKDQDKLFKLFGFIDSTKELNTQGIGLGLHISKLIIKQMSGDIICQSKWGQGTSFIFLIALDSDAVEDHGSKTRCINPARQVYTKINLNQSYSHRSYAMNIDSNQQNNVLKTGELMNENESSVLESLDFELDENYQDKTVKDEESFFYNIHE